MPEGIGNWPSSPASKKNALPPAHVHEQASRPKKARTLRLMDEDRAKSGPVRWIVRNGQPVPPGEQYERQ